MRNSETTAGHSHHEHHDGHGGVIKTTSHVTLHCLIGCSIGEFLGLFIGTLIGLGAFATMGLAVVLAFVFGISLAVWPVMKNYGMSVRAALATVWLGEVVSIAIMEIAMNGVAYATGGVHASSVLAPIFWIGFAVAVPCGYVAAWPVNWWLLQRNLKRCH